MENELLSFEVRFLKARFADPQRTIEQLESSEEKLKERLTKAQQNLEEARQARASLQERLAEVERSSLPPERRTDLEKAEKDLVALLENLSADPLARFFRRREAFRNLEERYL